MAVARAAAASGYTELGQVFADAEAEEEAQQTRPTTTRFAPRPLTAVLALVAAVAAAAVACGAWRGRLPLWSTPCDAASLLQRTLVKGVGDRVGDRICVEFPSVRLENGKGKLPATETQGPAGCVEQCRTDPSCGQVIFSTLSGGCYSFTAPTSELFERGNPSADFHSAYCGPANEQLPLRTAAAKLQEAVERRRREAVREGWAAAERRARALVRSLEQEDKVDLVHGSPGGMGYAGFLTSGAFYANDAIPLKMQDGPQGFNPYQEALAGTATQFPALLSVAASFDRNVARRYAEAVAEEFVTKGANVLLGPDVEVTRSVLSGRCFETISGEDPFLGSELVRPFVRAVQGKGIIVTVKHWLDNNQEIYRQTMTSEVGERTQHEVYMPVFKAAFEAGAAAVMCSYNKVNRVHACENPHLLKKLLRQDLGFKGYVVSDWGATHDATKSALAGLDVEMPLPTYYKDLAELVENGMVPQDTVDDMAAHVLSAMLYVGQFNGRFPKEKAGTWLHIPATTDGHREVALKTALGSAVLLKNRGGVLPLATAGKKIAMVGRYCNHINDDRFTQGSVYSGGGSGFVLTNRAITPLAGMQELAMDAQEVFWARNAAEALGADVAIICAAAHAEEGWDRANLALPEAERFVADLRDVLGPSATVVVLASVPGAVTTEWLRDADAALMMFEPGEQVGPAVAQLLTGRATPGGRLPVSLPEVGERRFTQAQYPGVCANNSWCDKMHAHFTEGVLVGYKWNVAKGIPSAFPFGFGLTYTSFTFDSFQAQCTGKQAVVSVRVTNTGAREGDAVPQLYVGFASLAPVIMQLRGFQKVRLVAGASTDVVFVLGDDDWSYYDETTQKWASAVDNGEEISVTVGASAVDPQSLSKAVSCGNLIQAKRK